MRIFIVENHRDTLHSMRLYCEDLGHEVETALNLEQAVASLSLTQADLLFCDIGLPDGSGWELLGRLGANRPRFAVAMSGFGMNADNRRSREAGFRYHLLKPFKIAELDKIMAEAAAEQAQEWKSR